MNTSKYNTFQFLLFLLVLLFPIPVKIYAQEPLVFPVQEKGQELYFRHITKEEGLPSDIVRYVMQDCYGYLWIGTDNGLVKYDGHKMEVFQHIPGDTNSVTESMIFTIFESRDSLLWIGTNNGFSIYDPASGTFENHKYNPDNPRSFPCDEVRSFWEDRDGSMWIATFNGIVHYFRDSHKYVRLLQNNSNKFSGEISRKYTYLISEDPLDTSKILVTTIGGLLQVDKASHTVTFDFEKNANHRKASHSMYIEGDSVLWTGEWGTGLKRLNLKTREWKIFTMDNDYFLSPLDIKKKSDDELWIATPAIGLVVFNKKNNTFRSYRANPANPRSILSDYLQCNLFIDKNHNLWFGGKEGLNMLDRAYKSFRKIDLPYGIDEVRCFFRDKAAGKTYFGTHSSYNIIVWDEIKKKWSFVPRDKQTVMKNARINYIYEDHNGTIWATSSKNSLLYIDTVTNTLRQFHTPGGNIVGAEGRIQPLTYLTEDKTGNLWITSPLYGIACIDSMRRNISWLTNIPDSINSLGNGLNYSELYVDSRNRLWVASYNGYSVYDIRNKKFITNIADTLEYIGIKNPSVVSFLEDTLGRMWVSLNIEGLLRITENSDGRYSLKIFNTLQGLNDPNVSHMAKDSHGEFWIINEGLVNFNPYTEEFIVFDKRNGLHNRKSHDDRIYIDKDDNIFLTCDNGFEVINRGNLNLSNDILNLLIEKIDVNGLYFPHDFSLPVQAKISLNADEKNIKFGFTAICFQDYDKIRYRYKLKGFDKDWNYTASTGEANYTNLAPGTYTFFVQAAHRGIWFDNTKSVSFSIRPYFWQTWWFISGIVLLIIIILAFVYKIRMRQLLRAQRIKDQFTKKIAEVEMQALRAQMNPHFIFNSLNSINNFILKNEGEAASDFLTKFSRLVRKVLTNSKSKFVSLEDEFVALKLYIELEQLRFNYRFTYEINIDHYLDTNFVLIPPLLLQPYVENAIWHGLMHKDEGGMISINVTKNDDNLLFTVQDNGIGRVKSSAYKSKYGNENKSMGMSITADRIKIINEMYNLHANVIIDDLYDEENIAVGTKVTISVPIITKEKEND